MRILKYTLLIIVALVAWTVFVGYGVSDGFLLQSINKDDNPKSFIDASVEMINTDVVKNRAIALIENGKIVEEHYYSVDQPINRQTVFPVASISKWLTSWGIMKLVQEGKLDLDKPVDDYLTTWQLPEGDFDNKKVTIRKLLSHSSGVTRDMESEVFRAEGNTESIVAMLNDPDNLDEDEAVVNFEPGSQYAYSNVAYAILQLVIEETTQQTFPEYMEQTVFAPLQMRNSTFSLRQKPSLKLAPLYDGDGNRTKPTSFTGLAAAGLFTNVEDLSKLMQASANNNPVLSQKTLDMMTETETFINKTPVYGLGPHLYSQNDKDSKIIGHDGVGGVTAINTAARFDLTSKDGIIVLQIGDYESASAVADEWLFWKAGIADFVVIQRNKSFLIALLFGGFVIIGVLAFFIILGRNKKRKRAV